MLKIVYMGTPDFAVAPLLKLLENKDRFDVIAAVTNKDKPAGRKHIMTACPVKQVALSKGIKVFEYDKIRTEGVSDMRALNPDIMVTCAFGQILSKEILDIPRLGVINVHASLLPKYRGASPIHYAIMNGEKQTGVTIMKTDVGIDTGDILISEKVDIGEKDTCGDLFIKLSDLGANLLIKALDLIAEGKAEFIKQDEEQASYTKMIKKEDALIDWNKSAVDVFNLVRAFNPAPGAYTFINGDMLKLFEVEPSKGIGAAGEILDCDKNFEIACGSGSVLVKKIQKSGGKIMNISDFLRGNKFIAGTKLG